jgi:hypothetical protein
MDALTMALKLMELAPQMISLGMDWMGAVSRVKAIHDAGRDPTPEEWDEANALADEVHRRIQAA